MTATAQMPDLRFPVGKFDWNAPVSEADYPRLIAEIAETPGALRSAVAGLSRDQQETRYRPGGWTVRQLVHHVADSHMNAYTRFRLALTEGNPTIKPYDEAAWAELPDARALPVAVSLDLLDRMHERLVHLLRATKDTDFQRTLHHPENGPMTMDSLLAVYAWHGRHHVAHVTALRERMKWS